MSKFHRPVETDNSNTTCIYRGCFASHDPICVRNEMDHVKWSHRPESRDTYWIFKHDPRNFNCRDLSGKFLVFKIGGPLGEMVAYRALSHREVRLWLFLNFLHRALH